MAGFGWVTAREFGFFDHGVVAFLLELAECLPTTVTANGFHPIYIPFPSLVWNAAFRTWVLVTVLEVVPGVDVSITESANRLCRLATDPRFGRDTGLDVGNEGVGTPAAEGRDVALRERVWAESLDLAGVDSSGRDSTRRCVP